MEFTEEKLQRWALSLNAFPFTIEHVSGEDNVWADLLTRWGSGSSAINRSSRDNRVYSLVDPAVPPNNWVSSVARPSKPRHVCPEKSVDLPSRKRAYVEFAGVRPLHQGEFVWPDVIELKSLQQEHKAAEKEIPGA